MRKLRLPVPVSIITGSLGVGKTTAICSLVSRKPKDEHWCVIVNEFGAVGIDAVAINSSAAAAAGTVTVKQIAGGCMCCAQSGILLPAIAQIIRQVKPDRVLIEPSGLGHPAGLLDILQGPHLGTSLKLHAIICLVDLSTFDPNQLEANPTAWDQIMIGDILIGSKADAAAPELVEAFISWTHDLFPPKSQVLISTQGQLDLACLDAARSPAAVLQLSFKSQSGSSRARLQQQLRQRSVAEQGQAELHAGALQPGNTLASQGVQQLQQHQAPDKSSESSVSASQQPFPGKPQRMVNNPVSNSSVKSSSGVELPRQHWSCGWVFDSSDQFDPQALLQMLQTLHPYVARVKGVFRTGAKQWVMPVAASGAATAARSQATDTDDVPSAQPQPAGSTTSSSSTSNCQSTFELQPVCYRGPSMMEVIMNIPDQQYAADTAAGSPLMEISALQAALSQLQQKQCREPQATCGTLQDGCNQQQQQQECAEEHQGQLQATAAVQQLSLADSSHTTSPGSTSIGNSSSTGTSRATDNDAPAANGAALPGENVLTGHAIWELLEEALLACLQH